MRLHWKPRIVITLRQRQSDNICRIIAINLIYVLILLKFKTKVWKRYLRTSIVKLLLKIELIFVSFFHYRKSGLFHWWPWWFLSFWLLLWRQSGFDGNIQTWKISVITTVSELLSFLIWIFQKRSLSYFEEDS